MNALRGLYALTSQDLCGSEARMMTAVDAALAGGAKLIQYRDKWNNAGQRRRLASALLPLCRRYGVPLIINDDVALAAAIDADGVHLGAADTPLDQARAVLGRHRLIGVSCNNDLERAYRAAATGADYVAFGRFFASGTKPTAPPADLELLRRARVKIDVSLCAIGGMTPENTPLLLQAGADLVAAVEGVFGAADIEAAARAYSDLFADPQP